MTPSTCVASKIQEGCTPPIRLNVNLDAGLLLFWTVCFVIWRRPVVGASGGTFS